ncbi:MAG TPA: hypothetical protein VJQ46_05825 [Gemmatimonadales bacterium]|nr:hypothetical protein [Gemmatimonadales bacterium]
MKRFHARMALVALVMLVASSRASAQWELGLGIRAPRFSGGAVEPTTGLSLRPYRPTMIEAGLDRAGRRVGVGVLLHYASSSLALEGAEALSAVKDALTVYGAEPFVAVRVAGVGPEGVLRMTGGPLLEVWKLPDVGSRTRLGAAAALELAMPFGGRWSGVARLGGAVTPSSPFTRDDLDPTLEPRALWRREVAASLRYRM